MGKRKFYSIRRVADTLNVSYSTVIKLMDEGELRFITIRGRRKILVNSVDEYKRGREEEAGEKIWD